MNNKGADQNAQMHILVCAVPEDWFSCIEAHVMSAHLSVLCTHMHENGIKCKSICVMLFKPGWAGFNDNLYKAVTLNLSYFMLYFSNRINDMKTHL